MAVLLFDLDGTLVDSAVGIGRCATHAFVSLGEPAPDEPTLRSWIGPPLRESFLPLLRDAARVEQALAHYHERYDSIGWREHAVYEGIPDAVRTLASAGHRLLVVTAKNEPQARRIVEHLPFGDAFDDVVGASADGRLAHKPELIAEALRRHDLQASDCRMIGDRRMDMEGALHHAMPGIGVLWGFGGVDELTAAGASALASHPSQLASLLG
jgi:phosphoglycolate phosphatase